MGEFLYGIAETLYPFVVLIVLIAIPLSIGKVIAKWATKDAPAFEEDDKKSYERDAIYNNYQQGHNK